MLTKKDQLKKNGRIKPQPYKSKEYLAWLHVQGLGCMVCGNTEIELHHIDQGNRGRADNRVVPLCVDHHRGSFSPHGFNKKAFVEQYDEVMEAVADRLFNLYKEDNNAGVH